jgi:hypothetical protein
MTGNAFDRTFEEARKSRSTMQYTPAFGRFVASTRLDHDRWRDGVGYDLKALEEIAVAERAQALEMLTGREITWREVEALAVMDLPAAREAVDAASKHYLSFDTRLAAAAVMHRQGRLPEIESFLCRELRNIWKPTDGLERALGMAREHPTGAVKQALLYASYNGTECAPHCAAMLCYLCNVTDDPFDWNLRPVFLKLGLHNNYYERKEGFEKLCALVNMTLDTSQ